MRLQFSGNLIIRDKETKEVLLNKECDQSCIIYETINSYNLENNILPYRYIGSDWNNNPNYFGSSKKLKKDIEQLGKEWFQKNILYVFNKIENISNKELRTKEAELLTLLKVKDNGEFYNLNEKYAPPGNIRKTKHKKERVITEKWLVARRGKKRSLASRLRMSLAAKNRPSISADSRLKRKEMNSGDKNPNAIFWTIISPTGIITEVKGLRHWCLINNISYSTVYHSKKGWKSIKHGAGKGGRCLTKQK